MPKEEIPIDKNDVIDDMETRSFVVFLETLHCPLWLSPVRDVSSYGQLM